VQIKAKKKNLSDTLKPAINLGDKIPLSLIYKHSSNGQTENQSPVWQVATRGDQSFTPNFLQSPLLQ
jgi:hypothetical protein